MQLMSVQHNMVNLSIKPRSWAISGSTGNFSFISQVLQCSSEYPTNNSLRVLSQEIGVDSLLFLHALSVLQESKHRETLSHHCDNVVAHHPVELNTFSSKGKFLMESTILSCTNNKCAESLTVLSKTDGHISALEDAIRHFNAYGR
jgi:hypothetical protein